MSITQSTAGAGGGELDRVAEAYEARVAAVPERARQFADDTWGKTWAHAEMSSLLDFAALASAPPAGQGNGEPAGWKLVPVEPTKEMLEAFWAAGLRGTSLEAYGAMLASAPPAPTPEAGSDLAKLSAAATQGEASFEVVPFRIPECDDADLPGILRIGNIEIGQVHERYGPGVTPNYEADGALIAALWNAYRSGRLIEASASPPAGEDLAGQGEPVAWACEILEIAGDEWFRAAQVERPADVSWIRNIRPLYAAPAPSRPADREEIAEALYLHERNKRSRFDTVSWQDCLESTRRQYRERGAAVVACLALRDAPRNGGDWTQDTQGGGR